MSHGPIGVRRFALTRGDKSLLQSQKPLPLLETRRLMRSPRNGMQWKPGVKLVAMTRPLH
ncbi:hypothetical protein [Laspinema palackyanum]|uniref:hypothetical protein n=1 Tax=Laspinema palackyanum TaxID=3231601 RepID=UPI00345DA7F6|nr:hypothetical protein [Laspinema sp. D2c]